jgi:hypothetical protein
MTLPRIFVCALLTLAALSATAETLTYGPELRGFDYPYPVEHFTFSLQGQTLDMAYMCEKASEVDPRQRSFHIVD